MTIKKITLSLLTTLCVALLCSCGNSEDSSQVESTSEQSTVEQTSDIATSVINDNETSQVSSEVQEENSEESSVSQSEESLDITAENIVKYFTENSAPNIGEYIVYDETTDPNELLGRPGQYTSKCDFAITTIETGDESNPFCATVEVFENENDAKSRYDYISGIYESMPMLQEYMYMNANVILRMDFDVLPSEEKIYEELVESYIKSLQ